MLPPTRTLPYLALVAAFFSLSCAGNLVQQAGQYGTAKPSADDRESLMAVQALIFTEAGYSAARRGDPHPQLECVGGAASGTKELYPVRVECYNVGVDEAALPEHTRPKWHCVTALHRGVRIDNWDVHCEGWSYPDDDFVLKNSCWLSYDLEYEEQVAPPEAGIDGASADVEDRRRSKGFWAFVHTLLKWVVLLLGGYLVVNYLVPFLWRRYLGRREQMPEMAPLVNNEVSGHAGDRPIFVQS